MFLTKLLYFCAFSIYGMVLPFLPLILRARGLADSQISFVLGALGLAALVAPLPLAHFADRRWDIRTLLRVKFGLAAVISTGWLWAPGSLGLFTVTLCFFSCYLPALALLDAHTLRTLGSESRAKFQSIRVCGSWGFILPGLVCALLQPSDATLGMFAVAAVLASAVGSILLTGHLASYEQPTNVATLPSASALRAAFSEPLWRLLWPAALGFLGMAIYYAFYPLYLRELGLSAGSMGIIYNLGVVAEIILMPFTGRLISRFGSRQILGFAICAVLIRMLALGLTNSLWVAVISQILHGPIVIGFLVTLPIVLQEHADDSYRYSLQSLYVMIFLGIVRLLGPWLAGIAIVMTDATARDGLSLAFLLAAACSGAGLVLYIGTRSNKKTGDSRHVSDFPR